MRRPKAAREGLSPTHRLPAPLRKILPRSKSAVCQDFNHNLKLKAEDLWRDSVRYERMKRLDANYKASDFAKLTCTLQSPFYSNLELSISLLMHTFTKSRK